MSTGNGLPPLPTPPSAPATIDVQLTLPADLLADLKKAAKEQLGTDDINVAVAMCVQLWRYPPQPAPGGRKPRARRAR